MNDISKPYPASDAEGLTTPFGMLRYAEEYRRAAELVHGNDELLMPAYTLLGHCYELALKAYLMARGTSVEDLSRKPYGHNLTALWDESFKRRIDRLFPMVMLADDVIRTLNIHFQKHEFRYIKTGVKTVPIGSLRVLLRRVSRTACITIVFASALAKMLQSREFPSWGNSKELIGCGKPQANRIVRVMVDTHGIRRGRCRD